jgi:hypothetical protein
MPEPSQAKHFMLRHPVRSYIGVVRWPSGPCGATYHQQFSSANTTKWGESRCRTETYDGGPARPDRFAGHRRHGRDLNGPLPSLFPFRALVQFAEHLSGLAQPTARGGNLRGVSAVPVVAVPFSLRGATAVRATVHSAPAPPGDRRRFAWRARPGLGSAAGSL